LEIILGRSELKKDNGKGDWPKWQQIKVHMQATMLAATKRLFIYRWMPLEFQHNILGVIFADLPAWNAVREMNWSKTSARESEISSDRYKDRVEVLLAGFFSSRLHLERAGSY
jgi:hypothetical protein